MAIACGKCGSKHVEEDYVPGIGKAGLICRHCGQAGREGWITGRKVSSRGRLRAAEPIRSNERDADMARDQLKPGADIKKICKKCNERETMSERSPYCAKCLGDMARAKKEPKQPLERKDSEVTKQESSLPGKAAPGAITEVTIDFKGYPDLLDSIRTLATEEVRPVDLQIIYLLKSRVNDIKKVIA